MGASKEGMMSVREKINLGLHLVLFEEDDDPPDGRELDCQSFQGEGGSRFEVIGGSRSPGGNSSRPRTSVDAGNSVISSLSSGQVNSQLDGVQLFGESDAERLRNLLQLHVKLNDSLQERLKEVESNTEIITRDRNQLQSRLESQRKEYDQSLLELKAILKGKDEQIAELQKELSLRSVKVKTEDKETCVTPPPVSDISNNLHVQLGNHDEFGAPAIKRARYGDSASTTGVSFDRTSLLPNSRLPMTLSQLSPRSVSTNSSRHVSESDLRRQELSRSAEFPSSHFAQHWSSAASRSILPKNRSRYSVPEVKRRFFVCSPSFKSQSGSSSGNELKTTFPRYHIQNTQKRSRSNNFLKLNQPKTALTQQSPGVKYPRNSLPPAAIQFQALDQYYSTPIASSGVPLAQKRKVGRPPGSVKPKTSPTLPQQQSNISPTVPNGTEQESPSSAAAPPPPQRFSQRGRLLKPNRARYSPDPDSSPTLTPKFPTPNKKGYLFEDQFAIEGHEELLPPLPLVPGDHDFDVESGYADENDKADDYYEEDGEDNDADSSSKAFVEVPKWRIVEIDQLSDSDEARPIDDMSEEAYMKRHQKLEAKEKQRKRWDSQRLREESYREKLQRKQEERERLKEIRRQQRKRNKGRNGASEEETEESVMPSVDDIKAIYIGDDLPVGAFGHPIPLVEKVDFCLPWDTAPALKEPLAPTPRVSRDENKKCDSDKKIESESACRIPTPVDLHRENAISSTCNTVHQQQLPSSPSSSSLSLPSIPSPGRETPPPVIYPEYDDVDEEMDTSDGATISTAPEALQGAHLLQEDTCLNLIRSTHVEPAHIVVSEVSIGNGDKSSAPTPVSNPQPPPMSPFSVGPESELPANTTTASPAVVDSITSDTTPRRVKDLRPRTSAVVRFPQVGFPSASRPGLPSSSSTTAKERIGFFIPNPLAPRQRSSISPGQAASKSSSSQTASSSVPSSSSYCKDS